MRFIVLYTTTTEQDRNHLRAITISTAGYAEQAIKVFMQTYPKYTPHHILKIPPVEGEVESAEELWTVVWSVIPTNSFKLICTNYIKNI